jgi:DNA polymerase elongation subunit (family B)
MGLWIVCVVIGEPISEFTKAVEKETGILTEVDSYDWITFLPMADGSGAYNRYFVRLDTAKMKIRGVMARKGDTPEYIRRMQQDLFDVLAKMRSLDELRMIQPIARGSQEIHQGYPPFSYVTLRYYLIWVGYIRKLICGKIHL